MSENIKLRNGLHVKTAQLDINFGEPLATWARPNGLYAYAHPHRLTEA